MMNFIQFTSLILPLSFLSFFLARKKGLMSILSLEMVLLNMFLAMMMTLKLMHLNVSPSFYILVLGACEASLAMSILIIITRFKGNDMLTKTSMKL